MSSLDLTQKKADEMSAIEDLALKTIKSALEGNLDAEDEKVKVSVKMLSTVAKNRQTMTNRAAIEFSMARCVASEAGLKKYVQVTSPQIQKAIGGK